MLTLKRKLLGVFITVGCCTASVSGAPYLYYDFEAPDTTADNVSTDVSGNGRNGTFEAVGTGSYAYVATTPAAISSHSSQSLRLTESSTTDAAKLYRAISATDLDYKTSDWSFAAWYRIATSPAPDNETIFHLGSGDGFGGDEELYIYATGTSVSLQNYNPIDVSISRNFSTSGGDASAWHHVAVVHEPGTAIRFYVDGTLVGTDTSFVVEPNQAQATVFGGIANASRDRNLDGWLDDVALYDSALTGDEVSGLASGTLTPLQVPEPAGLGVAGGLVMLLTARRRKSRCTRP